MGGVSLRAHAEASFLPEGPAIEWIYINSLFRGIGRGVGKGVETERGGERGRGREEEKERGR